MGNFNKFEKNTKEELLAQEMFELTHEKSLEELYGKMEMLINGNGGPEEFFSSVKFELWGEFENLLNELSELAFRTFEDGQFTEVIAIGRNALRISGVGPAAKVSVESPDGVIALSEAVNYAAKTISYAFYGLKPLMIAAASQINGVHFGYGDDGVYYLSSPTIGAASFHDSGEVHYLVTQCLGKAIPEWEYSWSGVSRQEKAFEILESMDSTNKDLVKSYADLTSPEEIRMAREKYMKDQSHNHLFVLGNILKSVSD